MRGSRAAAIALFAFLGLLGVAKFPGPGPYGLDASYYTQIASNVARGNGYVSTISLYNHGQILPATPPMLPLWPLVLGYAGRAMGVIVAANVVPKLFYFLSLLLLWVLARAVAERLGARPESALLVAALFGVSLTFYTATTHPYREGLAFTLAFAALIAVDRYAQTRSTIAIAASGLLAGLATLTRVQMAAVAAATMLVLARAVLRERRTLAALLVYGFCSGIVLLPWFLFTGSIFNVYSWRPAPATVVLPGFYTVPPGATVASTFKALFVAFDVTSPHSFARVFGVAALLAPIALFVWLWNVRREHVPFAIERMVVPVTAVTGLISLAILFPYQGGFLPYYFGWRHGLVLIFVLIVAIPYLLHRGARIVRIAALALIAIGCLTSLKTTLDYIRAPNLEYTPAEQQLLAFLGKHPRRPMILTTHAQTLGMATDALIHNTSCEAAPEVRRAYFAQLPVHYLVVYDEETPCPFVNGVERDLRLVRIFGAEPRRIFLFARPRRRAAPPVLPSPPAAP